MEGTKNTDSGKTARIFHKLQIQMVYIRFMGTHGEYDKIDCSNI